MVLCESHKFALYQHIVVALHDGTLCHSFHICEWVISLTLATFGGLDGRIECTVFIRQISVCLIAGLFVKTTQRNIMLVHIADVIVCCLTDNTAFIGLLQCSFRYGIHLIPQGGGVMVSLIIRYHLFGFALCICNIILSCQSSKTGIVTTAVFSIQLISPVQHTLFHIGKHICRILVERVVSCGAFRCP